MKTELSYVAAAADTVRLRVTQTAGPLTIFHVDDAAVYTSIDGTLLSFRATARLSRTEVAAGVHSLEIGAEAGGDVTFNGVEGFFSEASSQDYRISVAMSGPAGKSVRFEVRLGGVLLSATQILTGAPTFDVVTLNGTSGSTGGTGRFTLRSNESAALTFYADELKILPGAASANPGQIVVDVHTPMVARGTLDFLTLNFDGTLDTSGLPWSEDLQFEVDPAWSLWDLLEKFIGMGYSVELAPVNWREGGDSGWELNMWAPLNSGVDWSLFDDGPAILPGDTIRDVEPSSAPPAETVVYGEGSGGVWTVATASAARIANLERREAFVKADHAKDTVTLFRVLSSRLDNSLQKGAQFTSKLTDDADPLPFFDFINQDRLRAHLPTDSGRDKVFDDTYLVAAITFRGTAEGTNQEYEVDFGRYKLHAQQLRDLILARQLGRESTENYQKGTGSVSSAGAAAVASSSLAGTEAAGEVVAHPHVWADLEPAIGGDLAGSLPNPSVVGLRGTPIATNAPADNQVLTYDSALGQYVPEAGGGGGGGGTLNTLDEVDTVPASPDAMDDEFDDDSFDTGLWSDINIGGVTKTEAKHALVLGVNENVDNLRGIYQTVPSGDWKFRAKILQPSIDDSFFQANLFAAVSTSSTTRSIGFWCDGVVGVRTLTRTSPTTAPSGWGKDLNSFGYPWVYVEIEWDDTAGDVFYRSSTSGLEGTFGEFGSITSGFVPTIIGLSMTNRQGAQRGAAFDWFRRIA